MKTIDKELLPSIFHCHFTLKWILAVAVLSLGIAFFNVQTSNAQPELLKDINIQEDTHPNEYSGLTMSSGKVYFVVNGSELWKTTGSAGGTIRLKIFRGLRSVVNAGAIVYFSADDGNGLELWKSNGTVGGTVMIKEFVAGPDGGSPEALTLVNSTLYFSVYTVLQGRELWKTDGTSVGTVIVKDIQPGKRDGSPGQIISSGNTIYFSANDGKTGFELWKSDGTASGTTLVKDIRTGTYLGSSPQFLRNVNGTIFFAAVEATTGQELWKSNGTAESTMLVKDIRPGTARSGILNVTTVNSTLFFSANDGVHGQELWKSDGSASGTILVKDMTPGKNGSSHGMMDYLHDMGNFTNVNGLLYYTAYQNQTYYIWKSDGTEQGTVPLVVASNALSSPVPRFLPLGSYIYYFNSLENEMIQDEHHLFRMDANGANPLLIETLVVEDYYERYDPEMVVLSGRLIFYGRDNRLQGFKLFSSNGTPGSMVLINDASIGTLSSNPATMVKTGNNNVFFVAEKTADSYSLWRTDGTPGGTIELRGIENMNGMVSMGTQVLYSVGSGLQIWKSDGTPQGTVLVKADASLASARNLVFVNNLVFFEIPGSGLWRTDGTTGGTFMLPVERATSFMQVVGDLLYFTVRRSGNLVDLWRTNGTATGTAMIKTFSGRQKPFFEISAAMRNLLVFVADDGLTGNEVWVSNGTRAGTYLLADINSRDDLLVESQEGDIRSIAVWNNNIYISALDNTGSWSLLKSDGTRGDLTKLRDMYSIAHMIPALDRLHLFPTTEPDYYWASQVTNWVTDGTVDGTRQLNEQAFYVGIELSLENNVLYYSYFSPDVWRSDGTACGTYPIPVGLSVYTKEIIGNVMVFNGAGSLYGNEPFAYNLANGPASPCPMGPLLAAQTTDNVLASKAINGTPYPNPFVTEFSLHVNGLESDVIAVNVFTISGHPVETINDVVPNTDCSMGASWPAGLYLLSINISGKLTTQQVLKK